MRPPVRTPRFRAGRLARVAPLLAALVMAGCATHGPPTGPASGRDGPEARPPSNLDQVPDAVPKIEPIRIGGPNKPYQVDGHTYVPITDDRPVVEKGMASWYGKKFHGRRTASGEAYNMYAMTAAHPTLPIPSYARVRNPANGREVIVRINDRGPFASSRIIDLSYTAAMKLGVLGGVAPVEVERITGEAIRTGAWLRQPAGTAVAAQSPSPAPASTTPRTPANPPGLQAPRPAPAPGLLPDAPVAVAAAAPLPASGTGEGAAEGAPAEPPATVASAPDAPVAATPSSPAVAETTRALVPGAIGFWIQLGAYRQRDGALGFQKQVADQQPWLAPLLAVYTERGMHKLQAGPYPSKDEARNAAERVRLALQLVPTIVEKR